MTLGNPAVNLQGCRNPHFVNFRTVEFKNPQEKSSSISIKTSRTKRRGASFRISFTISVRLPKGKVLSLAKKHQGDTQQIHGKRETFRIFCWLIFFTFIFQQNHTPWNLPKKKVLQDFGCRSFEALYRKKNIQMQLEETLTPLKGYLFGGSQLQNAHLQNSPGTKALAIGSSSQSQHVDFLEDE